MVLNQAKIDELNEQIFASINEGLDEAKEGLQENRDGNAGEP